MPGNGETPERVEPDAERVACWRDEAAALFTAERGALQESSKILGIGIPALAAAAGVALSAHHPEALLALPFALLLLVTYLMQVYGDVAAMGGARLEIEAALAKTFDERDGGAKGGNRYLTPLVYERFVVGYRTKYDWSQWTNGVALGCGLAALVYVCLAWPHVPGHHAVLIRIGAIALTVLAAIPAVIATQSVTSVRARVWRDLRAYHEGANGMEGIDDARGSMAPSGPP